MDYFMVGRASVGAHVLEWSKEKVLAEYKDTPINGDEIWAGAQAEKKARKAAADAAKAEADAAEKAAKEKPKSDFVK